MPNQTWPRRRRTFVRHARIGLCGHQQPAPRVDLVHLVAGKQVGILFQETLKEVFVGVGLLAESLQGVVGLDKIDLS